MTTPPTPPKAAKVGEAPKSSSATAANPATRATANTSSQPEVDNAGGASAAQQNAQLRQSWDNEKVINELLSGSHFEPNAWNQFNNITYHWRFFAMPDVDFLYEDPVGGEGVITNILDLYARIDSYKQVTIAETGVTGYNVDDVEMRSVFTDDTARGNQYTEISMKINEPNGVSFLDSLRDAAHEAGIRNYIDFYYYLELTCKGYDPHSGAIDLSPFSDLPNGGRWLWAVKITNIDVNLNSGGGQYKLSMIPFSEVPLDSEFGKVIDTAVVVGKTIKEFFDNLATSLNKSWKYRLGKDNLVTHSFQIHGVPGTGESFAEPDGRIPVAAQVLNVDGHSSDFAAAVQQNDINVAEKTASQGIAQSVIEGMVLTPKNQDWSSIRSMQDFAFVQPSTKPKATADNPTPEAAPKGTPDKATMVVDRGHSISEIINAVFASCEAAQCLAKDSSAQETDADDSSVLINSKGVRETVSWHIIPEVRINKIGPDHYDYLSNRYGRQIIWHIYPLIDYEPILSRLQIKQAFDKLSGPKIQQATLAALAARGFLPKRYDYIFTGNNTEVLNFDLNFNFAWSVVLPRIETYFNDQALTHATYNAKATVFNDPIQRLNKDSNDFETLAHTANDLLDQYRKNPNKTAEELAALKKARKEAFDKLASKQQDVKNLATNRKDLEAAAKATYGDDVPIEQDYSRAFIETVRHENASNYDFKNTRTPIIPFSYSGGDEVKKDTGLGNTGQWHAGRSLFGAVTNQVFGPVTGKFQQADMTIRGDPFWIGQASFEKQISHNVPVVDYKKLAHTMIGSNCFIFRFKYPTGIADTGNFELKDNETVTGVYKVVSVNNKFVGGAFTQQIQAIRLPLIDLFTAALGLNNIADEQPTKPAAPIPAAVPVVVTPAKSSLPNITYIPVRGG